MKMLFVILALAALLCGCGSDAAWKHQEYAFAMPPDPPSTNAMTNIVTLNHVSISPLFQSRSFTYRNATNAYEQDPYAGFLASPERALAEPIRANLAALGRVVPAGSALTPNLGAEVEITKLFGDFQDAANPTGTLQIHFLLYEMSPDGPGRVIMDELCGRSVTLTARTPAALMTAWDAGLRDIMTQILSDYAKANSNDGR